jgi:SAM-dependent methyltransferase
MPVLLRRLLRKVFSDGLASTARSVRFHSYERYREWSLGIQTARPAYPSPEGPRGERQPYEPLTYTGIDAAFRRFGAGAPGGVLLDYGCGKGRVTSVAATYPLRRVIGVEIQAELCEAARENMHRVRGRLCHGWEIVQADASAFDVPDDVSIFFLFNPFVGSTLRAVVTRIEQSLARAPRLVRIIYGQPCSEPDVFRACGWLRLAAELPLGFKKDMRLRLHINRSTTPEG